MAPIPTAQLVLGIDTHRDLHVAVLLDRVGRKLATAYFDTTDAANAALLAWTRRHGQVTIAGVEGTGSYGYRLAQQLIAHGIQVVEVNRPDRTRRRRKGKSDPIDAEAAARAVLAGDATAIPKCRNGAVGQLRALVMARRSAIKARTQATNQLRALLSTPTTSCAAGSARCASIASPMPALTWIQPVACCIWPCAAWVAAGWLSTRRSPTLTRQSPPP